MDNASVWTRRSNAGTGKLSLSMKDTDTKDISKTDPPRTYTERRYGPTSSHGAKGNPFNALSPASTKSPSASASFGLGAGAFASFGAAAKPPKTPGTGSGFDFPIAKEKKDKEFAADTPVVEKTESEASATTATKTTSQSSLTQESLKDVWSIFYRPPSNNNKFEDYEKSITKRATVSTPEEFWLAYIRLKRPSQLPTISDYHIFKEGIRPVWEDEANKKGGRWYIRLKKGVADRYWELLLMALIGDQFFEAGDEVCGAVISVRSGEDVLSIWTKNDGGRNIKIRETVKRLLDFPPDTNITWESHKESIARRSVLEEVRHAKAGGGANNNASSGLTTTSAAAAGSSSSQITIDKKRASALATDA